MKNENDGSYHVSVHQDLMAIAGKERQFSKGASNYYHLAKHPDRKHIEKHYDETVLPILRKHKFPDRFTDNMHNVQKEIVGNWRKEQIHPLIKEEAPTVAGGNGAIAGIGIGPDGEPPMTRKKQKKYAQKNAEEAPVVGPMQKRMSFKQFMNGK